MGEAAEKEGEASRVADRGNDVGLALDGTKGLAYGPSLAGQSAQTPS